jgi:asparagine synthase (glutamine-hydrolysing)
MCGIAGVLDVTGERAETLPRIVDAMASAMHHRGPDDEGVWSDRDAGIAVGFRRLSIVDLTEEGHQPMASASGRHVIVFNGEIYNHVELRATLEGLGHGFRGRSDTEVLLAAVTEWGARGALDRLNGMFAYALWDRRERLLHLVRDRVGEKPLYYGRAGSAIVFASELKAFRAHPDFSATIDPRSLAAFFRYKYVPSPLSIYRGVSKLPPGAMLTIRAVAPVEIPEPSPYWNAADVARAGMEHPFEGSPEEAADELDGLLRDAVRLRMQADVPLGAFLSGGVDSSTVVALMQAAGSGTARTFTIGSTDERYDEARDARQVAAHLGTQHTDLMVTPREALDVIPRLPEMFDEPFADSSQIPTFLVSRLAREHVTVALSGDGGDELFGGYDRYRWLPRVWGSVGWLPRPVRRAAARAMTSASPQSWQRLFSGSDRVLPEAARHRMIGDKVHKLANMLGANDPDDAYLRLISHWNDPSRLVVGADEPPSPADRSGGWLPNGITERLMYLDLVTYLPDDILAKVDRASMSVSLEARVPLLDPRVVEFAWRLPLSMKLRGGKSKWLLRQVLSRYVPDALIDRPKTGFGVPIAEWLRGPLREWADSLLDEGRLADDGFLEPGLVGSMWQEHLSGKYNRQYPLWDVLMFGSWLEATHKTPDPLVSA